jgi:hypothetical protein
MRIEGIPINSAGELILRNGDALRVRVSMESHAYRTEVDAGHNFNAGSIQSPWKYEPCKLVEVEDPSRLPTVGSGDLLLKLENGRTFEVQAMKVRVGEIPHLRVLREVI